MSANKENQLLLKLKIEHVLKSLRCAQFPLHNEKALQEGIADHFDRNNITYQREYRLSETNIPDFFIEGIAIEVKIKESAMIIFKQCRRYCEFSDVKALILVTNRSMGFPEQLNEKPCYVVNLGKAWL